jgi:hypothetical protein
MLRAGLMQLVEGLVSPRVELGVEQRRGLVIAFSSRYKLTGATAPSSVVGDLTLRRNRKGGASVQMSETHVNSARGSLLLVQKAEVFCVKPPPPARAAHFAWAWAVSGWFQPITIHSFYFSFSFFCQT